MLYTMIGFVSTAFLFGFLSGRMWQMTRPLNLDKNSNSLEPLPDNYLFLEAYNEVAQITGDKQFIKKLTTTDNDLSVKSVIIAQAKTAINQDILAGQHWKIKGISRKVYIASREIQKTVRYWDGNNWYNVDVDVFLRNVTLCE